MARTPIEELRLHIEEHRSAIAYIERLHGPSDGGGRTTVRLVDHGGQQLITWDDWTITDNEMEIVLREHWRRIARNGLGYHSTFTVSDLIPRESAP